jgi:hypothetical protein
MVGQGVLRECLLDPEVTRVRSKTPLYRVVYAMTGPFIGILRRLAPGFVTTTEQVGRAMLIVVKQARPNSFSRAQISTGSSEDRESRTHEDTRRSRRSHLISSPHTPTLARTALAEFSHGGTEAPRNSEDARWRDGRLRRPSPPLGMNAGNANARVSEPFVFPSFMLSGAAAKRRRERALLCDFVTLWQKVRVVSSWQECSRSCSWPRARRACTPSTPSCPAEDPSR